MPLAARRSMPLLAFAVLMLSARCAPYLISQDLRGDSASKTLYIYPPGSRPWKPVRATQSIAKACNGLRATSTYFELRQRTMLSGPTLVVRDRGKLPPTKAEFDADVKTLFNGCDPPERADLTAKLWARMPRTFADDLLSRYGFEPAQPARVDLRAGMRLRVEWAAWVADVTNAGRNSYIATGTTWWTIGTRPDDGRLTFEPVFGWGSAGAITRLQNDVAAGVVDLEALGAARKYYRLIYSKSGFSNARQPDDQIRHDAVLVGSDTRAELDALTADYVNDGRCNVIGTAQSLCTRLAGRSVPIPEIQIHLGGARTWVSFGTTLRHIVERDSAELRATRRDLRILRVHDGEWRNVVADDTGVLASADLLDLPLVQGDRIEW